MGKCRCHNRCTKSKTGKRKRKRKAKPRFRERGGGYVEDLMRKNSW